MPNIRPIRDYNEHEVLPTFFTWSGTIPTLKGTFVKIVSGASADNTVGGLGDVGLHYQNTVSQRYGVPAQVALANSGDKAVGMLLYDIRELDENGEKLILHPDKMARMQATPSGWPCVILRRGFIQYSGSSLTPVGQGETLYLSPANDGGLSTGSVGTTATAVAKAYGPTDSQGYTYIYIDVR